MILLVYPSCKKENYNKVSGKVSALQPNLYMALFYSFLRSKGIETLMVNCDVEEYSNDDVVNIVRDKEPKLVGIICIGHNLSSSTMTMVGATDLGIKLRNAKLKSKVFIIGGHPTVLPEQTLGETMVDHVVVGEGYNEIVDLYSGTESGSIIKTKELINVDSLPMVDWGVIDPSKYRAHNWHRLDDLSDRSPYAVIWTSMGCPYPCEFCAVNTLFKGDRLYRKRSMVKVMEEIDILVNDFGVKNIKIIDELFVTPTPRLDEFCSMLEERKYDLNMWCFSRVDTVNESLLKRLKGVGMSWIAYGFETNNQDILNSSTKKNKSTGYDRCIKMTKDAGLNICADVVVGLPGDDNDSIKRNFDFCCINNFEFVNVYPAFAYPGTELFGKAIHQKLLSYPLSWDQYSPYSYECIPLRTDKLTSKEVLRSRDEFFRDYHLRPEYLSMIRSKFGPSAEKHIKDTVLLKLDRRLYE